jgi:uncharacterized protein (DUF1697 family)
MKHVALLRGINVTGKNKLPMADLVAIFEAVGAKNVATYIQSGNVVFEAPVRLVKRLGEDVPKAIAERFGYDVPVVLRTAAEMEDTRAHSPFLSRTRDHKQLHVMFLRDRPSPAAVAALPLDRSPPDELRVIGSDVFLYLPNGMGRSKITNAWLDRQLGTVSTARNWRTVETLIEMCGR